MATTWTNRNRKKRKKMEIKTEEVFHNGDAPFNRIHAAVGVYQNTGSGSTVSSAYN